MSNLIAIACADLHIYKFNSFNKDNSRLNWSLKALREIAGVAEKNKVPMLLSGDLFHTPLQVENETLSLTLKALHDIHQANVIIVTISGNHDMSNKNGINHRSPSYLQGFSYIFENFRLLDGNEFGLRCPPLYVWGIPYMNNDHELRREIKKYRKEAYKVKVKNCTKILLLHGDCPGAKETNGIELGENKALGKKDKLDTFFAPWDYVLFGHIHVPQKISKKCYMLGSPIHQNSGDSCEMGYWKIFSDRPPKFIGLVDYPKFRKLGKGEKPDNERDYFIPYEEVGKIEEIEAGDFDLSLSRTKLAKRYMKRKGIKDPEKKRALINALKNEE